MNCYKCDKNFNLNQLNKLKCGCLFCDQCLEDILNEYTSGYIILNPYEKAHIAKIDCFCGAEFDYDDIISHYKNIIDDDKNNAEERLLNYINSVCFICGEAVKEDNVDIKENKTMRFKKQNNKEKGLNYSDLEHVVCGGCFDKNFKKRKKNENKNSVINYNDGSIFCKICQQKHYLLGKYLGNENNVCAACSII